MSTEITQLREVDETFDTPILFLVFNRAHHSSEVFNQIRKIKPTKLYIVADGPREDRPSDRKGCYETRQLIMDGIDWPCQVKTLFREKNLGCKLSVSDGITWFFNQVEEGIILEDDCVPNISFFYFCRRMLEKYRFDQRILQISGSNYLQGKLNLAESYYFTKINDIWGWATWKRGWEKYDLKMTGYDKFLTDDALSNYMPVPKIRKWLQSYLDESYTGKSNVWSSQWVFVLAKENALTIAPALNLVTNVGSDGIGEAANTTDQSSFIYSTLKAQEMPEKIIHPEYILPNVNADLVRFQLIRQTDPRLFFKTKLRKFLSKIKRTLLGQPIS